MKFELLPISLEQCSKYCIPDILLYLNQINNHKYLVSASAALEENLQKRSMEELFIGGGFAKFPNMTLQWILKKALI